MEHELETGILQGLGFSGLGCAAPGERGIPTAARYRPMFFQKGTISASCFFGEVFDFGLVQSPNRQLKQFLRMEGDFGGFLLS